MSFILIDRRKAGKGKSSPNRQKLLRRIRTFIKTSSPQNIGTGGVTGSGNNSASPVKVASAALEEPWFAYSNDGEHTAVLIGNREYDRGDEIELPEEDGQGGKGGPGDAGEDDFIVGVSRDEFLDLFFDDCELPNLTNEKWTEKLDNKFQQSGFSTTGTPAQLSIVRTFKTALGRRNALKGPYRAEKEELLLELQQLEERVPGTEYLTEEAIISRIAEIYDRLEELEAKFVYLDNFDKSDLRFRKKEAKPLKTVDAVIFMVMDISGSMDENKKKIARRWFALLYAFIRRRYTNTELVFIAHTDEAFEMSEDDFFSTRINGGTTVSPALKMVNTIIKERYDPNQTNIYVSHASDGDNWDTDTPAVIEEMTGTGQLLNKIQFFSYVEVGKNGGGGWFNLGRTAEAAKTDTTLWEAYSKVHDAVDKKITMAIIETPDDCYSVFKRVFGKKK